MTALQTSKHLLSMINHERFEEFNDGISNLKLQKLLFYIQKTSLSYNDEPFFDDAMEAWQYGPVVQTVYHHYKEYGSYNINVVELRDTLKEKESIEFEKSLIIDFVWDKYNKYTAGALVDMTHADKAWKENYIPRLNIEIPIKSLKDEKLGQSFKCYKDEVLALNNIKI